MSTFVHSLSLFFARIFLTWTCAWSVEMDTFRLRVIPTFVHSLHTSFTHLFYNKYIYNIYIYISLSGVDLYHIDILGAWFLEMDTCFVYELYPTFVHRFQTAFTHLFYNLSLSLSLSRMDLFHMDVPGMLKWTLISFTSYTHIRTLSTPHSHTCFTIYLSLAWIFLSFQTAFTHLFYNLSWVLPPLWGSNHRLNRRSD